MWFVGHWLRQWRSKVLSTKRTKTYHFEAGDLSDESREYKVLPFSGLVQSLNISYLSSPSIQFELRLVGAKKNWLEEMRSLGHPWKWQCILLLLLSLKSPALNQYLSILLITWRPPLGPISVDYSLCPGSPLITKSKPQTGYPLRLCLPVDKCPSSRKEVE